MTDLYDILKANRLKKESDPWLCILGEAWRASEEDYKEYTGLVPYTFIGNGQPLISWMIKSNTVQSGTPTPDNPVMPQGTGDRTAQLWNGDKIENCAFINGSYSPPQEGQRNIIYIPVIGGNTYTFSINNIAPQTSFQSVCSINKPAIGVSYYIDGNTTFITHGAVTSFTRTIPNEANWWAIQIMSLNNLSNNIMINEGSTALPHEPYGYKIPISSAGQTTPIYLGEVQTTRRIKKLVLTGTETVAGSAVTGGWIITNLSDSINNTTGMQTSYCSHFVAKNNGAMSSLSQNEMCISTQYNNRINFVTTFATAEDFKSYLAQQYAAGTPVTVWYVLATEQTGIVNEPLMCIGDYADSISDVASIPTVRGENIFDVDTEVKPSEVYIKYKSR